MPATREICGAASGWAELYLEGDGVTKDDAQAKALFTKACDGGEMSGLQRSGAMSTMRPWRDQQDYAQALSLWQKACDGGVMKACENVGQHVRCRARALRKISAQAVSYYRKGCAGGEMESCSRIGLGLSKRQGVTKDLAQAVTLYQQGVR